MPFRLHGCGASSLLLLPQRCSTSYTASVSFWWRYALRPHSMYIQLHPILDVRNSFPPRVCPCAALWDVAHHRHRDPLLPCLPWDGQCESLDGHQCCLPLPWNAQALHEGVGGEDNEDDLDRSHRRRHCPATDQFDCVAGRQQVSTNLELSTLWFRAENDIDTVWSLPIGLFLTSFGWWESFVQEEGTWSK